MPVCAGFVPGSRPYASSSDLDVYRAPLLGRQEGGSVSDVPTYPPLDPNSDEGKLRKAYHELGERSKIVEQAHRVWHSLSEWMVDEHTRRRASLAEGL